MKRKCYILDRNSNLYSLNIRLDKQYIFFVDYQNRFLRYMNLEDHFREYAFYIIQDIEYIRAYNDILHISRLSLVCEHIDYKFHGTKLPNKDIAFQ